MIEQDNLNGEVVKNEHEFCLRCGRKLKNSYAREVGYGAVCLRKLRIDSSKPLFGKGNLHS